MAAQQTRQSQQVSQQPLFYKKVVPLSKERSELYIHPKARRAAGAEAAAVPGVA